VVRHVDVPFRPRSRNRRIYLELLRDWVHGPAEPRSPFRLVLFPAGCEEQIQDELGLSPSEPA
jgi:hypothetical protein